MESGPVGVTLVSYWFTWFQALREERQRPLSSVFVIVGPGEMAQQLLKGTENLSLVPSTPMVKWAPPPVTPALRDPLPFSGFCGQPHPYACTATQAKRALIIK